MDVAARFLAVLVGITLNGWSLAEDTPVEPAGLRQAVADHINAQAEIRRTQWHAKVEDIDPSSLSFKVGVTALSAENSADAVVLFSGQHYCGSGGCRLEIYQRTADGFRFISGTTLAYAPIRATESRDQHGWKSLIVSTRYYGEVALGFDGKKLDFP